MSKYFKPGFIFKNNTEDNNNDDDDALETEDLDLIISQASDKFQNAKSETLNPTSSNKIDEIASQDVDFTSKNITNIPSLKSGNTILVNSNQRQNPLLQNFKTTRYVITDSIAPAHYVLFDSCCALFLSLKYHVINPEYIYERVSELKNKYQLKILLVMIDHIIYEASLKELTVLAIRTNFTLMLAWNYEEAAKHIENYRNNADKPPDVIMGRSTNNSNKLTSSDNQQSLIDALTCVKAVNRTDAVTLLSTFETFENLVKANTDELTICPGISMIKARRIHSLFNKPFIKK